MTLKIDDLLDESMLEELARALVRKGLAAPLMKRISEIPIVSSIGYVLCAKTGMQRTLFLKRLWEPTMNAGPSGDWGGIEEALALETFAEAVMIAHTVSYPIGTVRLLLFPASRVKRLSSHVKVAVRHDLEIVKEWGIRQPDGARVDKDTGEVCGRVM